MTQFLQILNIDGTELLFELEPSEFNPHDQRTVEPLEVPGNVWNTYFDSIISAGKLTFGGIFVATDNEWVGYQASPPRFYGRPYDFIHKLRSLLRVVDSATGDAMSGDPTEATYKKLIFTLQLNQSINGTPHTYNLSSAYSNHPVFFTCESVDCNIVAGSPLKVSYTIVFVEVAAISKIGGT